MDAKLSIAETAGGRIVLTVRLPFTWCEQFTLADGISIMGLPLTQRWGEYYGDYRQHKMSFGVAVAAGLEADQITLEIKRANEYLEHIAFKSDGLLVFYANPRIPAPFEEEE